MRKKRFLKNKPTRNKTQEGGKIDFFIFVFRLGLIEMNH